MKKLLLLGVALLSLEHCFSQSGQLDHTFGFQGTTIISGTTESAFNDLKLMSDGTIVCAGTQYLNFLFYTFDYNAINGSGGYQDFGYHDIANAIAIDSLDRILMVGTAYDNPSNYPYKYPRIVRRLKNGSTDPDFSATLVGYSLQTFTDVLTDVLLQADGKILVAGSFWRPNLEREAVIARLHTDGTIDSTFAQNGVYRNAFDGDVDENVYLSQDSQGNIVVAAYSPVDQTLIVTKLDVNGSPVNTFAQSGIFRHKISTYRSAVRDVTVQNNDMIVVTGDNGTDRGGRQLFAYRLTSDGLFDNNFSGDGQVLYTSGTNSGGAEVLVQSDGKILCSGYIDTSGVRSPFVTRFTGSGDIDIAFGNNGATILDIGATSSMFTAMALQSDGKILLSGYSYVSSTESSAFLARLLNDLTTGTEAKLTASSVQIYPNPSLGNINIETSEEIEFIELVDVLGRKEVHYNKNLVTAFKGAVAVNIFTKTGMTSRRVVFE